MAGQQIVALLMRVQFPLATPLEIIEFFIELIGNIRWKKIEKLAQMDYPIISNGANPIFNKFLTSHCKIIKPLQKL